jgi:hypothetical protein
VREKDALLRDLELQLEEAQHSSTSPHQQLELQQQAVLTDVSASQQQQQYSSDEILSSDVSSDVSAPSALPYTSPQQQQQQQQQQSGLHKGASSSNGGATGIARPRRSYSVSAASGCSIPLTTPTTTAVTAAVPVAAAAAAPRRHSIAIGRMHEMAHHHQQEVTPPSLFSEIRVLDMGHVCANCRTALCKQ